MKKMSKLLVVFVLTSMVFMSCKEVTTEKKESTETTETVEKKSKTNKPEAVLNVVLNANLATETDLMALGLSADLVAQILEQRPFLNMKDFSAILKDKGTEELYRKVFVPMNLNTTAEADFKIIPGVGDKMAHEFEEYRPYVSVKQFKREIGKYVDDKEVARFLNYVFVPVELNTASDEDIKALPGVGKKMAHEFDEYRPYTNLNQFRKEIGKYVDDKELKRLERLVYLKK